MYISIHVLVPDLKNEELSILSKSGRIRTIPMIVGLFAILIIKSSLVNSI